MDQDRAYLEELADKWVRGTITPAEAEVLISWYNSHDDTQQTYYNDTAVSEEEVRTRAFQLLLRRILSEDQPAAVQPSRQKRYLQYLPYAAVIFLAALAAILYFYTYVSPNRNAGNLPGSVTMADPDILPGGNRATLMLADGTKISLDSAKSGIHINGEDIKYNDGSTINAPIHPPSSITNNSITTPKGGQYQVILSDGTRVWLNAASTLTYPTKFTGNDRAVELVGEAFFDVAADKHKPFIVRSNEQEIQVIGTAFNISSYPGDASIKTTVVNGSVKVSTLRGPQPKSEVTLHPNEQATLTAAGELSKKKVDPSADIAWKSGDFYFKNTSFEAMMQQLIRWYDIDVIYQSKVPRETFSGTMERNVTLQTVLEFLRGSNIKFRLEGKKLIIQ